MGNFLWGIHHQEFPRESQWRIHHGEFTMGNSPWIWFPGHSSWIHQFAWGKESDSPRGIPHGEFSCGEFMWIFPVNSPQVSNEQYCKSLFYLSISEKNIKYINMKLSQYWVSVSCLLGYTLHDTLTHCRLNVGPVSQTMVRHWTSIGSVYRVRVGQYHVRF